MKKLWILLFLFFIGCETPQEKNKKEINQLKQTISKLSQKIDTLQLKNTQQITQKLNLLKQQLPKVDKSELTQIKNKITQLEKKLQKYEIQLQKLSTKQTPSFDYIIIHPTTLITTTKTNIYSSPNPTTKVLTQWDKGITFTSYKEKNNFIKVTGYFVDGKWTPNKKEWWINKKDAKIKIMER